MTCNRQECGETSKLSETAFVAGVVATAAAVTATTAVTYCIWLWRHGQYMETLLRTAHLYETVLRQNSFTFKHLTVEGNKWASSRAKNCNIPITLTIFHQLITNCPVLGHSLPTVRVDFKGRSPLLLLVLDPLEVLLRSSCACSDILRYVGM